MNYKIKFISEATFIAFLTIWGYLIAYIFTSSYLSAFGIPNTFIELTLTNILISISSLGVFFAISFWCIEGIQLLGFFKSKSIYKWRLAMLIIYIIVSLGLFLSFPEYFKKNLFLLVGLLYYPLIEFIFPLIVYRKEKNIEDRFIKDKVQESKHKSIIDWIDESFDKKYIFLILFCMITIAIAAFIGKGSAYQQQEFQTIKVNNEDYILAYTNSSNFFYVKIDKKNKTVCDELYITNTTNPFHIKLEKLGTLKLNK